MPLINTANCKAIQCGATSQLEANIDEIMECAGRGYPRTGSCVNPPQIPFSLANTSNPLTQEEIYSSDHNTRNVMLGPETKHRRDDYQEMVMCPGAETSEYMMGFESWRSLGGVMNKLNVLTDMGVMEWLGFLTPVALVGGLGYLATRK